MEFPDEESKEMLKLVSDEIGYDVCRNKVSLTCLWDYCVELCLLIKIFVGRRKKYVPRME